MQALQITQHGSPADLTVSDDAPRPQIGADDVLVQVEAAGVNPSDISSLAGRFPNAPLPRILGRDFAGRIVAGPADLMGKAVWGTGGDLGIYRDGAHAEYVVIPKEAVSLRPSNLTAEQAATVGVAFQTAWLSMVSRGALKEGEWVIVSGATGAVGNAALQIACALNANTIALVRNEADVERIDTSQVRAVAYLDSGNLVDVVKHATAGKGADLAVNGVGASIFQPMLDSLGVYGRMVVYSILGGREVTLDLLPFYRSNLTIHGINTAAVDVVSSARDLDRLAPLFESGAIAPPQISARYPLSKAAEAYQQVAAGSTNGKVIVIPDAFYRP